jgi:hypothetical protein
MCSTSGAPRDIFAAFQHDRRMSAGELEVVLQGMRAGKQLAEQRSQIEKNKNLISRLN